MPPTPRFRGFAGRWMTATVLATCLAVGAAFAVTASGMPGFIIGSPAEQSGDETPLAPEQERLVDGDDAPTASDGRAPNGEEPAPDQSSQSESLPPNTEQTPAPRVVQAPRPGPRPVPQVLVEPESGTLSPPQRSSAAPPPDVTSPVRAAPVPLAAPQAGASSLAPDPEAPTPAGAESTAQDPEAPPIAGAG